MQIEIVPDGNAAAQEGALLIAAEARRQSPPGADSCWPSAVARIRG